MKDICLEASGEKKQLSVEKSKEKKGIMRYDANAILLDVGGCANQGKDPH